MSAADATSPKAGRTVAAVHRQGGAWRLVALAGADRPRLVGAESASSPAEVRAAADRLGAGALIGVAPASSCVCRCVRVPAGPPAEIDAALDLMAEAELPSTLPPHRRVGGVLPGPAAAGMLQAALVGWTGDDVGVPADRWTSEVVALMALLAEQEPALAFRADADGSSIGLAGRADGVWFARSLRAGGEASSWREEAGVALAEAAVRVGLEPPPAPVGASIVWLDDASREALRARVQGVRLDEPWLERFGAALGAALAAATWTPPQQRLLHLDAEAPAEPRRPLEAVGAWLGRPANALALIGVSIALAVITPLAGAWLERELFAGRIETLEAALGAAGGDAWLDAERRQALYDAVEAQRWPMTKLLADFARALPVGADMDFVELKSGEPVVARGSADSLEIANAFVETLNASGVFTGFSANLQEREAPRSRPIEFELRGRVARPYAAADGVDDFAAEPLAVRLYGERGRLVVEKIGPGASDPDAVAGDDPGDDSESADAEAGDAEPSDAVANADEDDDTPGGRRSIFDRGDQEEEDAGPEPVPEPLTDDAIASMDRTALTRDFVTRQGYVRRHRDTLDDQTIARLEAEVERAKDRLKQLKDAG